MSSWLGEVLGFGLGTIYKNKTVATVFTLIIVGFNIIGLIQGEILISLLFTFIIAFPILFIVGMISAIATIPLRKIRSQYNEMFEQLKFKSINDRYPQFLGETETEYLKVLTFQSQIPIEEWINKQSALGTYLNKQIVDIYNSSDNNNIVHVLTVLNPLPDNIKWSDDRILNDSNLLNIGISYTNQILVDLNQTPHTFIAGETGSGKSNILKCLIYQCIIHSHEVKLIDFKRGVSFSVFDELMDVYSEYEEIAIVLDELVKETSKRLDLFRINKVEDIEQYNNISENKLKRIIVFIDELAELMRASDKQTNKVIMNYLESLTRISRAVGVNLIMGIQRPDSTIITGQIKNNVSMRICGHFVDPEPSRIMLGNDMATDLPGTRGRFIIKDNSYREFQAYYIDESSMGYLCIEKLTHKALNTPTVDTYTGLTVETQPVANTIDNPPAQQGSSEQVINFNFDDMDI